MFPFNTDGIDPHGSNMHIYNLTVQCWDDVVVPKPGSRSDLYDDCTQNYLIEDITVILGVGMTNLLKEYMSKPIQEIRAQQSSKI
jgi:polygalacturonase